MRAFIAAIILICFSVGQAAALSCMRPEPVATFNQLSEVPEDYIVLSGQLSFDASKLPQGVVNEQRSPDPISGRFVGKGLSNDGFSVNVDRAMSVQSVCYGPWCGQVAPNVQYLIFARVAGDDLVLEVDPCGTTAFPDPTQATLDQMTACITGNACKPKP